MPVTAGLIGGGINLLGGVVKGLVGAHQKKEGKRLLAGLEYPTESVPQEIVQNQNLAQQMAATGLPSEQYNNAMKNIQRQQLVALNSAHSRRGGLASVAGIQQGTNDATANLDVADAQQKIANQKNLMSQNNLMGNWKDKIWQNNIKDKYNRDYAYGMGLVGQGNQNLYGGIDQGIAGAGLIANGYNKDNNGYGNFSGYNSLLGLGAV